MMKRKISWAICLLWSSVIYAQDFTHTTEIEPVSTDGYHKILLSPELLGMANSNLSDLRIYDEAGVQQPYFIQRESARSSHQEFRAYQIIEREHEEDSTSYLIFKNNPQESIHEVHIIVENTEVKKRARLSGSHNQKDWFAIKNDYLLQAMHSTDHTTDSNVLRFPLSNYPYFKLEIDDNLKDPIHILKVGYYATEVKQGLSTRFDFPIKSQLDSANHSYITLAMPREVYLENLHVNIKGAEYYARDARILIKKSRTNSKNETRYTLHQIGNTEFNSSSDNSINLGSTQAKELQIQIDNQDNQPLQVEQVTASFLNQYAIAKLSPDHSYLIKFGDQNLYAPIYDLAAFKDQIPSDLALAHLSPIHHISDNSPTAQKSVSLFENIYLIWSIIGLVGVVLALVSIKMIKEMGNKA
ncbi:hypothetical protein [Reichenbachiella sp. MSK19-1]|uniref:hypothetical protein n=1 Tax=Reichenbachiella sp. MSK19-1 TaxID=1897631 RepID=UPI0011C4774B|nr:hypothetical protein [Reichenbachiella sp. MSK19-1]